jgi:peptide/nickel transport system permease protein
VVAGACVLAVIGLAAIVAPLIAPYPLNPTLDSRVLAMARQTPSRHHWFGTDELGRDQLTRILWGGRVSLVIGLSVALSSTAIGVLVGSVAGWFGGWVDQLLMRANDLLMVIPGLAVLMIAQKGLGGSMTVIIVVLSLLSWYTVARVVRAEFRSLQQLEFVEAARASVVGAAILAESALSFLGFGLQPPAVSWGAMLGQSRGAVGTPLAYLVYAPGVAILVTVLAVNFVGNGLRDAFDPRSNP